MTWYLARMELHNANSHDYSELHERMEAQGYTRTIRSDSGSSYWLPTAEYELIGEMSCDDAFERAKTAGAGTGKLFGAVVVQYSRAKWYGLPPA